MLHGKDPKVMPLCSISDVPLLQRISDLHREQEVRKVFIVVQCKGNTSANTPCGLTSSALCSNVSLAKHPSFSWTQDSHPGQTQLSTSTGFGCPIQPLDFSLAMLCCCHQCS